MARGAKKPAAARKKPATAVTNPYEPARHERASMDAMIAEFKETPYPPRMKVALFSSHCRRRPVGAGRLFVPSQYPFPKVPVGFKEGSRKRLIERFRGSWMHSWRGIDN